MRMMAWLVALAIWAAVPQEAAFQVGLAEIDITPPVGYRMDGYFYERLNTGQRDPLKAKALVFQQGATRAALVVCDVIGVPLTLSSGGSHAGCGANRHSRRQHRHHCHALAHRAALRGRAGAAVQRTGGGKVRQRPACRGEVSRRAARQAGRRDCRCARATVAGGHRAGAHRRRPPVVQPALSSARRHGAIQPRRPESARSCGPQARSIRICRSCSLRRTRSPPAR